MILLDILALPVTGPIKGTYWVLKQINDKVEAEMYDPDKLRADLIQLRISYERGGLSEAEYNRQAEAKWEQLKLATEKAEDDEDGDTADEE